MCSLKDWNLDLLGRIFSCIEDWLKLNAADALRIVLSLQTATIFFLNNNWYSTFKDLI